MRKSTFREVPRTQEELNEAYARAYDDDYQDKQFEEHCPYDEDFDKSVMAMLDARLKK